MSSVPRTFTAPAQPATETNLTPMDVYAEMTVPFDVAAWCRGRRLCVETVELRRALNDRRNAREILAQAERDLAQCEEGVAHRIHDVRQRMERDPV